MGFVGSIGFIGSRGILGYTGSGMSGVGLTSRIVGTGTTPVITAGAYGQIQVASYKAYALFKIASSHASWIRIYTSASAQTADASRTQGTDPTPGSGVVAEVITTGATSQLISPAAIGFNDDNPVASIMYITVTNLSGANTAITISLTTLQLEA